MRLAYLIFSMLAILSYPSQAATPEIVFDDALAQHIARLSPVVGASGLASELASDKVTVVTFFASWCPPCRDEFSHLRALRQRYDRARVQIVAINVFEAFDENDEARMKTFLQRTRPNFPLVSGAGDTLARFGGVQRIPTVFVFDAKGEVVWRFVHLRAATKMSATLDELRTAVQAALAGP